MRDFTPCRHLLLLAFVLTLPVEALAQRGGGGDRGGGVDGSDRPSDCTDDEYWTGDACAPLLPAGAECASTDQCATDVCQFYPEFDASACGCFDGYRPDGDDCIPLLETGEACLRNAECLTERCDALPKSRPGSRSADPVCHCLDDAECGPGGVCDAFMCHPAVAHGGACEVDAQCSGADTCRDGQCIECLSQRDCHDGDYCDPDGRCEPKVGLTEACDVDAACIQGDCIVNNDDDGSWCGECGAADSCGDAAWCSADAVCLPKTVVGQPCTADVPCMGDVGCVMQAAGAMICGECATDAACDNGEWCSADALCAPKTAVGQPCTTNAQCMGEVGCVLPDNGDTMVCAECASDAACGPGGYCALGMCEDKLGHGAACDLDAQCIEGLCVAGQCGECAGHDDCDEGDYCSDDAVCLVKIRHGETCTADEQCAPYLSCLDAPGGAVCVSCLPGDGTCGSDKYCGDDYYCHPRKPQDAGCGDLPRECGQDLFCFVGHCSAQVPNLAMCSGIGGDDACLSGVCDVGWCRPCLGDFQCNGDLICGSDGRCRDALEADYDPDLDLCGGGVDVDPVYLYIHEAAASEHISGSFTLVGGVVDAASANGELSGVDLANSDDTAPDDYVWIGGRGELEAGLFGTSKTIFALEASATRADGEQDSTLLVEGPLWTLYDEDISVSAGWSYTMTFFYAQATFYAVKVSADVSGTVGFDAAATLGATGIALTAEPYADTVLTLFAGVGLGCLSAGLEATVRLLDARLPITAQFGWANDGISWTLDLDAKIESLAGDAKFVIEACGISHDITLTSWGGFKVLSANLAHAEGCIEL